MRLSGVLLILPFVCAAPVAADHIDVREAPNAFCLQTASDRIQNKPAYCDCVAAAFLEDETGTGMEIFMKNFMHYLDATGGDKAKAEALFLEAFPNVDPETATGRISYLYSAISAIVDSGACD